MPATVNPLRPVAGAPRPYHFPTSIAPSSPTG